MPRSLARYHYGCRWMRHVDESHSWRAHVARSSPAELSQSLLQPLPNTSLDNITAHGRHSGLLRCQYTSFDLCRWTVSLNAIVKHGGRIATRRRRVAQRPQGEAPYKEAHISTSLTISATLLSSAIISTEQPPLQSPSPSQPLS